MQSRASQTSTDHETKREIEILLYGSCLLPVYLANDRDVEKDKGGGGGEDREH